MMNRRWQLVPSVVACIAVLAPEPARAEGPSTEPGQYGWDALQTEASDAAAAMFWEGKRLYDAGQYAQALRQFESAYAATTDPVLLYDIAQCQRQLGECLAAKQAYREFVEQASKSTLAPHAAKWRSELEQSCPDPPSSGPATAESPQSPVMASKAKPVEPTISGALEARTQNVPAERDSDGQPRWQLSLALLATGIAAGATATGLAIWNQERHQTWGSRDVGLDKGSAVDESDAEWAERQRVNDEFGNSIERTRRVTVALGVVSGAALIASAVSYFAFSGSKPGATAAGLNHRVMPNITPGNYQVLVSGAF